MAIRFTAFDHQEPGEAAPPSGPAWGGARATQPTAVSLQMIQIEEESQAAVNQQVGSATLRGPQLASPPSSRGDTRFPAALRTQEEP